VINRVLVWFTCGVGGGGGRGVQEVDRSDGWSCYGKNVYDVLIQSDEGLGDFGVVLTHSIMSYFLFGGC
jgi:hypothetical protein